MDSISFDRRAYSPASTMDYWTVPDGWPVRRFRWKPVDGAGARGSLLFLSGRGDMFEKYLESFAHWVGQGWSVTAFDWRGQGGSGRLADDPHVGHVDDFAIWIADLAAFYADWLDQNPGPLVVVAHSMGGHLLLRAMVEGTVRPDAAVLASPMLGLNSGMIPPWLGRIVARFMTNIGKPSRAAWKNSEKPGSRAAIRHTLLTHSADRYADESWWHAHKPELLLGPPSWQWMVAAFDSTRVLMASPALASMRVPTLLLGTSADRLVSPKAIIAGAQSLPDARLHLYGPSVAHEILRESDPARSDALARIDLFLEEKAPRA